MSRFQWREHRPSILVASLSAAFGVALLQVTSNLAVMIGADDTTGSSGLVQAMLTIVALVFIIIATYVGAVVTANTFSTIIAGRTRTIALLRLIGASAESQRRRAGGTARRGDRNGRGSIRRDRSRVRSGLGRGRHDHDPRARVSIP
jgi:putative ABC transport system permease protein